MKINDKHRLVDDARLDEREQTKSLFKSPEFRQNNYPDSIIIHYTAMFDYEAAIRSLSDYNPDGGNASAHLVIGKKGEMAQLAPFNYRTWHAGTSSYKGRSGYNNFSIGIEIDNLGWLEHFEDGDFYSRKELQKYYPDNPQAKRSRDQVTKARHWNTNFPYQFWDKYTTEQLDAVRDICQLLCKQYTIKEILGHEEIAVNRKSDPGPDFPMEWLRKETLFKGREGDDSADELEFQPFDGKTMATKLNIRTGPSANEAKAAQPLVQGTPVRVLEKAGNWYKIKTEITGWVHSDYVK